MYHTLDLLLSLLLLLLLPLLQKGDQQLVQVPVGMDAYTYGCAHMYVHTNTYAHKHHLSKTTVYTVATRLMLCSSSALACRPRFRVLMSVFPVGRVSGDRVWCPAACSCGFLL